MNCPACGDPVEWIDNARGKRAARRKPMPGDNFVCAGCHAASVFERVEGELRLRLMTLHEFYLRGPESQETIRNAGGKIEGKTPI